jgi:hypothetical protein
MTTPGEFREFGKAMIDYVADYLEGIRDRRVVPLASIRLIPKVSMSPRLSFIVFSLVNSISAAVNGLFFALFEFFAIGKGANNNVMLYLTEVDKTRAVLNVNITLLL